MGGHFRVARARLVGGGQRLIVMNSPCSPVDAVNPQPSRSTDHAGSLPYHQTVRWENEQLVPCMKARRRTFMSYGQLGGVWSVGDTQRVVQSKSESKAPSCRLSDHCRTQMGFLKLLRRTFRQRSARTRPPVGKYHFLVTTSLPIFVQLVGLPTVGITY